MSPTVFTKLPALDAVETNEQHVYPGAKLTAWAKGILSQGGSCLAFVCGATGSGKSQLALQASYELGASACLVSDDLVYEDHNALPLHQFPQALEKNLPGAPAAIICDDANADFSDFASKVVQGLGAGIPVRHIAWFVLDYGLPEMDEARQLQKGRQLSLGPLKEDLPFQSFLGSVRKIRSTFFSSGKLAHWTDSFITTEMLKSCWREVLEWDSALTGCAMSTSPFSVSLDALSDADELEDLENSLDSRAFSHRSFLPTTQSTFVQYPSGPWSPISNRSDSTCSYGHSDSEDSLPPIEKPQLQVVGPCVAQTTLPPMMNVSPIAHSNTLASSAFSSSQQLRQMDVLGCTIQHPTSTPSSTMTSVKPLSALLAQFTPKAVQSNRSTTNPVYLVNPPAPVISLGQPMIVIRDPTSQETPKPCGPTLGSVLNAYVSKNKFQGQVPASARF